MELSNKEIRNATTLRYAGREWNRTENQVLYPVVAEFCCVDLRLTIYEDCSCWISTSNLLDPILSVAATVGNTSIALALQQVEKKVFYYINGKT